MNVELVLSRQSSCACKAGQMEVELFLSRQSCVCEVHQIRLELVL